MRVLIALILLFSLSGCGEMPSPLETKFDKGAEGLPPPSGIVHSFENGYNPNDMAGWTGIGSSNNDTITNQVTASEFYSGLWSLKVKISHSKEQSGYCWLAMNLGPDTETDSEGNPAPVKRDLSGYRYISFYIKVMQDWTSFYVELGDISLPQGESLKVPCTVIRKSAKWQQVRIPLEDFSGLDLKRATKLVFSMNEDIVTQAAEFYLDDIAFVP